MYGLTYLLTYLLTTDRYYWNAWDPVHVCEGLFAVSNILNFTRLFHLLAINEHLGPMLISLERMIKVSPTSFLSGKRNASMRFGGYIIRCNFAHVSLSISRRRRRRESLLDSRSVIRSGLLPYWWRYLWGSPNAESKRGSGGPFFGLADTDFCHLTANVSKTVSRSVTCQLELNISSTRAF